MSWRETSLYLCTTSLYLCTESLYLCTVSLYLEKVVASKQLKIAMETDVERKARLESWPWRRRKKEEQKRNEFNLDLISKFFYFQGMSSLAL